MRLFSVLLFLSIFISVSSSNPGFIDSYLRFWYTNVTGSAGDSMGNGYVDDSDWNIGLGVKMVQGKSVTELIWSRFDTSAPLHNTGIFGGAAFPAGTNFTLEGNSIELLMRRYIFESNQGSFQLMAGFNYMDLDYSLIDGTYSVKPRSIASIGYLPFIGMAGDWYINRVLSMRGSLKYSEINLGSDEFRMKDLEFGLVYSPLRDMDFEVGYRNLSLDIQPDNSNVTLSHDMKGPYLQMNYLY
jgi:hypothetical protein